MPPLMRLVDKSSRLAILLFVGVFAVQMIMLLWLSPRLFWLDDALTQYSPAMWWLGQHRAHLMPPIMNPELGGASNFAADMQYGVFDPLHWAWQWVASKFSDMIMFSDLYGCVCLFIVGSGVLVQLLLRRVPPVLAASVAVGVSSSGFLLWFGTDWWPLMWSAGWLCWIWNGLRIRPWPGLVVLGISVAAFLSAGYPYFLSFAAVLIAVHFVEGSFEARAMRTLVERRSLLQYASMTGGLLYALPTLLTMVQSLPETSRPIPDALFGNNGFAVANLLDVVMGSPTLLGDTGVPSPNWFPVTYSFIITIPLVALIRWDRFLRVPGVLTGSIVAGLAIGATQLPAVVLGFRTPFVYLTVVEIFVPVVLVVLVVHARRITRQRIIIAALIVAAQVLLTVMRAPNFASWSVVALVVLGAALVTMVLYLSRFRALWVAAALAVLSLMPALLSTATLISSHRAQQALGMTAPPPAFASQPYRIEPGWGIDSGLLTGFTSHSVAAGGAASVYNFQDGGIDAALASGAFAGNQNLFADASLGYGYNLSVSQKARSEHECRGHYGAACQPESLLARAPSPADGQRWIDVLSQRVVLVNSTAPETVITYLRKHWNETAAPNGWLRFEKRRPLPGRITVANDVQVASKGWQTDLGRVGSAMEHYVVSTGRESGSLVFYTTSWPGFQATVNGRSIPVSALDGSVLRIDLPAGLDNALVEVTYAPIGSRLLGLTGVGPVIVLMTAAVSIMMSRKRRHGRSAMRLRKQLPESADGSGGVPQLVR